MWKQDKRQTNSFAQPKHQNNHRRQQRQSSHDHSSERGNSSGQNYRRPNYNRNQVLDSQGPEVKVKGTLAQIVEKYTGLARDANISGDRVLAENLLQHAEHYVRILNEIAQELAERAPQPVQPQPQPVVELASVKQEQPMADVIAPEIRQPEIKPETQPFQSSQPIF